MWIMKNKIERENLNKCYHYGEIKVWEEKNSS
jgi:hypothetical protein